jgi:hypothetical protein
MHHRITIVHHIPHNVRFTDAIRDQFVVLVLGKQPHVQRVCGVSQLIKINNPVIRVLFEYVAYEIRPDEASASGYKKSGHTIL